MHAQLDSITIKNLAEVNVNAIKASKNTPIAFTNVKKEEIKKSNLGQDLPTLISLTPSIVTTSDAGAELGIQDSESEEQIHPE